MSRSGDGVCLQRVDNAMRSVVCFCTLQIAFVNLDIYFGLAANGGQSVSDTKPTLMKQHNVS